ncbi:Glycine cleavage system transcriptional activator [Pseudovibrio sp. Ad46]|uniref:LysR family transcriptional regulator n=1 Tax=unclassified Pseudovibrio TaxID=2627060 RepID=UPI0007AE3A0C|nr:MULTISPECIES: LysR family transcriptional regulator [unclassified Pseudovibrio]KZK84461.1 Glycine cleavage system transcriptional activator [Pseudovibrio sp. Ad46]KZK95220.1 Glycine cleavage system transcriptional activator [Pseudovibrio sp. W74]KZK96617.1 Glycine cleavage system transcriptional activator [Pseudovibrio sp. Ad5]KZL05071.1 Glycine cleavage system transcriptional activator [Pseudovibrio sp. Ad14]
MTLPPLNALRAFEAVARLGSFKAAADALFVTQSAISHQVKNFETWLEAPLFHREGNRAILLQRGVELANSLSLSLTEIDAACHRARSDNGRNELVIAAIPSVAMCWLIPRLAKFKEAHPSIETRIIYAIHGYEIDYSDVHIAFSFLSNEPQGADVDASFFLSGDSLPVCCPALLEQHGKSLDHISDLCSLGLLHDGDTWGWQRWFDLNGNEDLGPLQGTTYEDFNLLRAAVLSAQGVALCPLAMVQPDLEIGALVQLSDRRMTYGSDYYLIRSKRVPSSMQAHIDIFSDWALSERKVGLRH